MDFMAPFEWASGKLAYGAGYIATAVGAKDTGEFLKSMNGTYVPEVYRQPGAATAEGRKAQMAESNRFTKNVVENIAPPAETLATTGVQTGTAVQGGLIAGYASGGNPAAIAAGVGLGWEGGEMLVDTYLESKGETAPARSLIRAYSPITEGQDLGTVGNAVVDTIPWVTNLPGLRGDPHYQKGGTIDTHPAHLAARAAAQEPAAGAAGGDTATSPGFLASITSGAKGFFDNFTFGMGSIIGAAIGVAAMFIPVVGPVLGTAVLVGGVFFGQKVMDMAQAQPATATNTAAPPQPNHPRSAATDPVPTVAPQTFPAKAEKPISISIGAE